MKKKSIKDRDEVTVHASFYGGLYVDVGELLRSKAARDNIKKMCEVFGSPSLDAPEAGSRSIEMDLAERMIEFKESMRSFLSLMDERILTLEADRRRHRPGKAGNGEGAGGQGNMRRVQGCRSCSASVSISLSISENACEPVPPIPPENNP